MENDLPKLITLDELCNYLHIHPTTAYKLLQTGEIKGFRIGDWKIPVSSVNDFINKKCQEYIDCVEDSKLKDKEMCKIIHK